MKNLKNIAKTLCHAIKTKIATFVNFLLANNKGDSKRKITQYSVYLLIVIIANFIVGKNLANIDYAWYSNVSIFLLVNGNIILILMLTLVIFRNLAKLLAESDNKIFGSNLKVKLVMFSITISVVPIALFYFFAVTIVNSSINRWFDNQLDAALSSSVSLMEDYKATVSHDLVDSSILIAQVLAKQNLYSINERRQLEDFLMHYIGGKVVNGIAIFDLTGEKIIEVDHLQNNYLNIISNKYLDSVLAGNQEQGYHFFDGVQVYWVGVPVKSNIDNDSNVYGLLFTYKVIPAHIVNDMALIEEARLTYKESTYFSHPIRNSYYMMLLLMAMLVMFAGIWGSILFAGSITKPIEELAEASIELSKGNMHIRIDEKGSKEIKHLIRTFNGMTTQIDAHTRELHNKNETLSEMYSQISRDKMYIDAIFKNVDSAIILLSSTFDIISSNDKAKELMLNNKIQYDTNIINIVTDFMKTDDKEYSENIEFTLNGDLRIYSMRLSKMNQDNEEHLLLVLNDITDMVNAQRVSVWREVATRMAHEIKNPLTPIKLLSERVKRKSSSIEDPAIKELISNSMDTIVTETDNLLTLVEDFNMFARLPKAKPSNIKLNDVVSDVKSLYTESYPNVKIDVNTVGNVHVMADRAQIRRVIQNLTSNAISAVNQEGNIIISIIEETDSVNIEISDNGTGIKSEDISRIFDPYFTKRPDGTGLGLAIVRKIIEEHNGKILVESMLDIGTTFTVVLPKGL